MSTTNYPRFELVRFCRQWIDRQGMTISDKFEIVRRYKASIREVELAIDEANAFIARRDHAA